MTTKDNWESMAKRYHAFVTDPLGYSRGIEMPAVLSVLPFLSGKRVLDLGCGSGRFAFEFLKGHPKSILGIDFSENMIELAQSDPRSASKQVLFRVGDISHMPEVKSGCVDLVFSSTVLHFIKDLSSAINEMHRVLTEEGICVLSLIHPAFAAHYPRSTAEGVERDWVFRYLDRSKRAYTQPWMSTTSNELCESHHHTLGDYYKAIKMAGFVLEDLFEPEPPEAWRAINPQKYYAYIKKPTYLILKLKKPGG